jgi:hypothetical protein
MQPNSLEPRTDPRAKYRRRTNAGAMVLLMLVLIGSNRVLSVPEMLDAGQSDVLSFRAIADAAPSLAHDVAPHHMQRFAIPYLLGLFANSTGLPPAIVFLSAVICFIAGTAFVIAMICRQVKLHESVSLIIFALLIFQASAFRHYIAVMYLVVDAAFMVSLALLLWALAELRPVPLVLACAAAVIARQTGVLLLPSVVLWIAFAPTARAHSNVTRWTTVLSCAGLSLVAFFVTWDVAFRTSGTPELTRHFGAGLVQYFEMGAPAAARTLGMLMLRPFVVWVPLLGWICGVALARRRWANPGVEFWLILLIAVLLWLQPVLAGPDTTGGNNVRLTNLAWPAAIVLAARWMASLQPQITASRALQWCTISVAFAASQHHHWSRGGALLVRSPTRLLVLQIVAGVAMAAAGYLAGRLPSFCLQGHTGVNAESALS